MEVNCAITFLFYAALHYVDAYIVARDLPRNDHATRKASMQHPFFDPIRKKYMRLKEMSREARYEIAPYTKEDVTKASQLLQDIKQHILTRPK